MSDDPRRWRPRAVPVGRASRLSQLGRLAGGIAGGMIAEGARRLAQGERPHLRDMLLTPGNFSRLADRMSHLRGAAMKLGQMISLDAGDLLPPELTRLLEGLRENADHMPPAQLELVLSRHWGRDWRTRLSQFDMVPIAAASIGQVHRAVALDGRRLAVKVQYPGVRESIDADVDNVATLLRLSGLLPSGFEIGPLLAEAKRQLHEEADYVREGAQMQLFAGHLAGSPDIVVPELVPDLTSDRVLAMTYVEGVPIETMAHAAQDVRDRLASSLIGLVLRELFEFGVMQTDPNFANYRYQREGGRLVLLDFGASRPVSAEAAAGYRALLRAALSGDRDRVREAALGVGLVGQGALVHHRARIDAMIDMVLSRLAQDGPIDFADRSLAAALRDGGLDVASDQRAWHVPPAEILFIQRKLGGMALLASQLKARIDLPALTAPYV
jgi:predicted unusual protein kinase regulating ubiquinone biosynthesis (AarF/ABC1/UbiB family)